MASQNKIVVYTGNLTYSVRKGIVDIDQAMPGLSWLILIHAPRKTPAQLLKNQRRNLRLNGWRWIPYQAADIWQRLAQAKPVNPASSQSCPGREFTLPALESRPNLRLLRVNDIHAEASLEVVKDFAPDIGLSIAAPILRRSLFSIPRLGTINLHKGKLPHYRGMPPAFWELWHDETAVGCTVHWVDDKLDTGDIVRQTSVERAKFSTLRGLQLHLDETGVRLMREAVQDIFSGTPTRQPQAPHGKTFRKPTLAQITALTRKLGRLQPAPSSTITRTVKDARTPLGLAHGRLGLRRLMAPRIIVLLYHRVSDEARDNLTVGIEQFDRQMALLRKHCQPLSIGDVVASQPIAPSGATGRRHVRRWLPRQLRKRRADSDASRRSRGIFRIDRADGYATPLSA
jgi:hypothetical protein